MYTTKMFCYVEESKLTYLGQPISPLGIKELSQVTYLGNLGDLFALPDPELFKDRGESGAGVYRPLLDNEQRLRAC